ncbi:MAG: hypothetical protein QXT64_05000 [Desulfurococcaceae archaeon]
MVNQNLRELVEREPERLLAALGVPPYSEKYTEEEKRRVLEALGITGCASCLFTAFVLDVLLPPPFRPPLMLIACFASGTCP